MPDALARRIADIPEIAAAPDVVLIADRTKKPIAAIAATYFAAEAYFRVDRVVTAARGIVVSDYFDRLALDRALDSIGDAERRLTAAMVETGATGEAAVEAWVKPRQAEVERIRAAIHQIAGSGLTLSKLTVAASLLGDLGEGLESSCHILDGSSDLRLRGVRKVLNPGRRATPMTEQSGQTWPPHPGGCHAVRLTSRLLGAAIAGLTLAASRIRPAH